MNSFQSIIFIFSLMISIHSSLQRSGNNCDCIKRENCKPWVDAINKGQHLNLPVCGFDQHPHTPLLCCPRGRLGKRSVSEKSSVRDRRETQQSTTESKLLASINKAAQKCEEYGKAVFRYEVNPTLPKTSKPMRIDNCGQDGEALIKNPYRAWPREFPHMAMIGFDEEDTKWSCAGSLISERYILTTAVCAQGRNTLALWAKLGELDTSTESDEADPQIYKIIEVKLHPNYNNSDRKRSMYDDIALLKLEKDVVFGPYIRPACLYTGSETPQNRLVVTGWGVENLGGKVSSSMKKIPMKLVSNEKCNEIYMKHMGSNRLSEGIRNDSMICAVETSPGSYVCQGDSGAPLQTALKEPYCMYGLVALTSFGGRCGSDMPGVNTRLSHYLPWIVDNTWSQ